MVIVHKLGDFLFELFPKARTFGDSLDILKEEIESFYSFGPYKPKVSIQDDNILVEIDTPAILSQQEAFKKVVGLCEKGKYKEAKPILKNLILKNPSNSEYHRIMGQILSDEGDQEESINSLIDALRWDSRNGYALLMMGNIFMKEKKDTKTAMKYFNQALEVNPKDYITMNNIGVILMEQGKLNEAKEYFKKGLLINEKYPNTLYALGLIEEKENNLQSSFEWTIQSLKCNQSKDQLYQNSIRQVFDVAKRIIDSDDAKKILSEYRHKLEFEGGVEIDLEEDPSIPTSAKIEFAENYDRDKHIIKFKPGQPAKEHLVMHELVHLDLVIEARKENINQLFISTQEHKREFVNKLESNIKVLRKNGISEESSYKFLESLFEGLNRQVYNAPIDLFIEDFLFRTFQSLRPYQFFSLYSMVLEGVKAVTNKNVLELTPKDILSFSKIYNLVNAIQFKELYGIDMIKDFDPSTLEQKLAQKFYDEFLEYKEDRQPGEEYELVLHWAQDLKLDKNFELVDEKEFRTKRSNADNILSAIENDPYGLETPDPAKDRDMEQFRQSQKKIGTNMAVVLFMVEALKYFEGMTGDRIKTIAVEIAMQGIHGYRPDKMDYRISSISGKVFSGYHILAYYYVSWILSNPEMVPQLQLPYEEEYGMAKQMFEGGE